MPRTNTTVEMEEINRVMTIAESIGLATEVIHTALKNMSRNPKQSIAVCMSNALADWDK